MKKFIIILCSLGVFSLHAQKESIQLSDLLKIQTLSKPIWSKDGKQLLFGLQKIEADPVKKGEYQYVQQVYRWTAGELPQALTQGKSTAPQWSSDGKGIGFLRSVDGKMQVHYMSLSGGEAQAISQANENVEQYRFSADGKTLYYSVSKELMAIYADTLLNPKGLAPSFDLEKAQWAFPDMVKKAKPNPDGNLAEIRAYLRANEQDQKAKVIHQLDFQEETQTSSSLKLTVLYRQALEPGAKAVAITPLYALWSQWELSSDEKGIYAIDQDLQSQHPDRNQLRRLIYFDLNQSRVQVLQSEKQMAISGFQLSPSAKAMVFSKQGVGEVAYPQWYFWDLESKSSPERIPVDGAVQSWDWEEAQGRLYFNVQQQGGVPIMAYDLKSKQVKTIKQDAKGGYLNFDVHGNQMAVVHTQISNPNELEVFLDDRLSFVSTFNASWLKNKSLVDVQERRFKNSLGQEIQYWTMEPLNRQPGQRYPLLLEIHGGPTAMWGPGELSMWHEFQYFAAKGIGVVYSNPRGSGGYGTSFMASNKKDWGNGPMQDVIKALELASQATWVDQKQLLLTGGSYAGYLVAYILGHDQRFLAACAQRGVYELTTFMGEGNAWRLIPNYFGSYPWEPNTKALLDQSSPLSYVQNIQTPLIIFHGENDLRTGVIQSEMLYKSLKILQRPVEYVRHPGASHEITRSGDNRQRMDQMLRTYEFFMRYLNKP